MLEKIDERKFLKKINLFKKSLNSEVNANLFY